MTREIKKLQSYNFSIYGLAGEGEKNINELENSIRELIINKKLREKLGINAKQRAENELSWKIISNKYLSIIKSLTN